MADEIASEYSTFYKKTTKRPKGIVFILFLLVVVLIGIFVALRFFSVDQIISSITQGNAIPSNTPIPTKIAASPTETPEITPADDEDTSPTPSSVKGSVTPTKAGTKANVIDRSLLVVEVRNGSGEAGAARRVANELSALGYELGSVGNADKFDYTGITIQVKSTKGNFLEQLKKDLSEDYTVSSATKDLPSSSKADALVIYGENE